MPWYWRLSYFNFYSASQKNSKIVRIRLFMDEIASSSVQPSCKGLLVFNSFKIKIYEFVLSRFDAAHYGFALKFSRLSHKTFFWIIQMSLFTDYSHVRCFYIHIPHCGVRISSLKLLQYQRQTPLQVILCRIFINIDFHFQLRTVRKWLSASLQRGTILCSWVLSSNRPAAAVNVGGRTAFPTNARTLVIVRRKCEVIQSGAPRLLCHRTAAAPATFNNLSHSSTQHARVAKYSFMAGIKSNNKNHSATNAKGVTQRPYAKLQLR